MGITAVMDTISILTALATNSRSAIKEKLILNQVQALFVHKDAIIRHPYPQQKSKESRVIRLDTAEFNPSKYFLGRFPRP